MQIPFAPFPLWPPPEPVFDAADEPGEPIYSPPPTPPPLAPGPPTPRAPPPPPPP